MIVYFCQNRQIPVSMKMRLFFLFLAVLPLSSKVSAQLNNGRWELLGTRKVDYTIDRDVIPVTWRDGAFDAIRIVVRGGALNMHKCIIHFENGGVQDVEIRQNFDRRSTSRIIDLPGNNRLIEKIVFWYDTKNLSGREATVFVFGRH
jgi:hypothetical protein